MLQAFGKLGVGGGRARLVEHVERARRRGGRVGRRNQSAGQIAALIRLRAGISYALTEAIDEGHCGLLDAALMAP